MQNNRIHHMCDRSAEIVFIVSTHDALSFTVTITRHKAAHHLRLFSIPHGEYKDDIRTAQLSQYFRDTKTRYRIGTTLEVIMSCIISMEAEQHSTYYLLLVSCTTSGLRRVSVQCMQLRSILSHQTRPDVIHHPLYIYGTEHNIHTERSSGNQDQVT
eukprot:314840_1